MRVTDGDTLVLGVAGAAPVRGNRDRRTGGTVARLIGVDAPEASGASRCHGRLATAYTRDALLGRRVRVAHDVSSTDRFGRALVYVWHDDGAFFNAQIVASGHATAMTVPPDVRHADLFVALARDSRKRRRGVWSARCDTRSEPFPADRR